MQVSEYIQMTEEQVSGLERQIAKAQGQLEELRVNEGVHVLHYLMVDGHYTWWECGRSYLCRIFDMLHMGYVDEVLFGSEAVERLPELAKKWVELENARQTAAF